MSSLPVIAQTAGPGAARVAARRRKVKAAGTNRRPGWVTYLILGTVLLISAYPIYYTFLLASSDQVTISQHPIPDLIPDGLLMDNVQRVLNSDIPLVKGVVN